MRLRPYATSTIDERRVMSVGELVEAASHALTEEFPQVHVRGEVSSFYLHRASGHWYFKLKDSRAILDVAMFAGDNQSVPFDVSDGIEVIAGGYLKIYADPNRDSKFELVAQQLEPVGWGALQLAFEQLKERLAKEGLFAEERKRPIPLLPRTVGVVTSADGAAWQDLLRVWRRREVPIRVVLAASRVQGEGAGEEIAARIEALNRHGAGEVLIVGRGGGSREDLWAFNEEVVARAIAASAIPVISAIGHEIDVTIADLVADQRAATPTAAAEIVAASRGQLLDRLGSGLHKARSAIHRQLSEASTALHRLDPRIDRRLRQPGLVLQAYQQRLDEAWARVDRPVDEIFDGGRASLQRAGLRLKRVSPIATLRRLRTRVDSTASHARSRITAHLQTRQRRLVSAAARLDALSPLGVLARGYAICERARDGRIVRRARDVAVGDRVKVRLESGELDCEVEETRETAS